MSKSLAIALALVTVSTVIVVISMSRGKTFVSTDEEIQQETNMPSVPLTTVNQEPSKEQSVPLPQQEDVIRTFFNLIDQGQASEAVEMLTTKAIADDSQKQAWGVEFNAFESVKVTSLTPSSDDYYKVVINVVMKPESANAAIPYYGFYNGENTRWVGLEKEGGLWKITSLATGP